MIKITDLIPPMTDPMGRNWKQPELITMKVTLDNYIVMPKATFDKLSEYSGSYPSGVYDGKMWKCKCPDGWHLCWYGPHADPRQCSINSRPILIKEMMDLLESK